MGSGSGVGSSSVSVTALLASKVGVGVHSAAVAVAAALASAVSVAWGTVSACRLAAICWRSASSTSASLTVRPRVAASWRMTVSLIIWSSTWTPSEKGLLSSPWIWVICDAKKPWLPNCRSRSV